MLIIKTKKYLFSNYLQIYVVMLVIYNKTFLAVKNKKSLYF